MSDHVDNFLVQTWKPNEFLLEKIRSRLGCSRLCKEHSYLSAAVLNDSLQFFVDEFHTAQTGVFQTLDLPFNEQFEGDLWNEQSRSGTLDEKRAVRVTTRRRQQ